MKLLKIIFIFLTTIGMAQSQAEIHLSVVAPEAMNELNSSQISKIETKIQEMVTNYGISGEGYFVIYPKYEMYNHSVVEGMRNMHLVEVDLSLIVKELQTGKVYNTYSQSITGDGYSKAKAIDQSISQIKTSGEGVEAFLSETKQKIMDYYKSNCNQIYTEAGTMINQDRYREAIALLYPVPKETGDDCYNRIQSRLNEAYKGYMNETCEENLVKARNAMAKNNNKTALEALDEIDPESNCYSSAKQLNQEIKTEAGISLENKKATNVRVGGSVKYENKRSQKIEMIAEAQYKSRHQMEMAKFN